MNKMEQIREYFREYGPSSAPECAKAIGIQVDYVHKKISDLRKKGWLVRLKRGLFEYRQLSSEQTGKNAVLQKKMWHAMRMCPTWTQFDIAQLSGATLNFVGIYVTWLLRAGHIQRAGKAGRKVVYRCKSTLVKTTPRIVRLRVDKAEMKIQELKNLGWVMMRSLRDGDLDVALLNCDRLRGQITEVRSQKIEVRK